MEEIAAICRALDALPEQRIQFGVIEIKSEYGELLGHLVDEVGGAFAFESVVER
jgi:hypothetical protein